MRAWMMILFFFSLPILGYAASVTELPDWKSTGYRVDFSSDDSGTTVVIGKTFPSARVSFEEFSAFSGTLYACDGKTFVADTCDLLTALTADVPEFSVRTNRDFYIVVVTTGDASWLKIRGSHEDIIGGSILEMDDVDETSFVGKAREVLAVNDAETLLEFVPRLGDNETEIYSTADLPTAIGGVITLPTGTYVLKNNITLSDSIQVAAGGVVEIISVGSGPTITYTGTGAFIQDNVSGFLLILNVINITLTGNGASLLDTNGTGILIDRVTFSASGTGSSLGTSEAPSIAFSLRSSQINGFVDGLVLVNAGLFILSDVGFSSPAAGGTVMFSIDALSNFIQVDNITVAANVAEDIFNFDASFAGTAQISRVNNVNDTGFFEAGSLDETSPFITVAASGMQKDSKNIGSIGAIGNTTATDMSGGPSEWVDLNLDTNAFAAANIELWTLDSTTTGQVSYDGIRPFHGTLTASISGTSSGGSQTFQFRAVLNGSPITNAVPATRDFNATTGAVTLIVPIIAATGNTVGIQVQNIDGTSDIVVTDLAMDISWILLIFIPIRREYAEAA